MWLTGLASIVYRMEPIEPILCFVCGCGGLKAAELAGFARCPPWASLYLKLESAMHCLARNVM